ncbi:antitoxin [Streptomyces sp. NPDC000348]|uniref:antitoxin n=1 Tax=Streptomyces sp. NPDC000348 TaxID=3364538 RepID=UPI0036C50739
MGARDTLRSDEAARDKAERASDTAERKRDERTGGTHEQHIDTGRQRAGRRLGTDRDRPDRP